MLSMFKTVRALSRTVLLKPSGLDCCLLVHMLASGQVYAKAQYDIFCTFILLQVMQRSLSYPGLLFFFFFTADSLPFFFIIQKLNSFQNDFWASLCGLHFTWGFSSEKYGGSEQVGLKTNKQTRDSRTSMKITVTHIHFHPFFNVAKSCQLSLNFYRLDTLIALLLFHLKEKENQKPLLPRLC